MARAGRAAEYILQLLYLNESAEVRGVKRRRLRREDQIDPLAIAQLFILFQGPRIAREILLGSKLNRVDEDGHDHKAGLGTSCLDETGMPGVKRAHRGDQANGKITAAGQSNSLSNGLDAASHNGHATF